MIRALHDGRDRRLRRHRQRPEDVHRGLPGHRHALLGDGAVPARGRPGLHVLRRRHGGAGLARRRGRAPPRRRRARVPAPRARPGGGGPARAAGAVPHHRHDRQRGHRPRRRAGQDHLRQRDARRMARLHARRDAGKQLGRVPLRGGPGRAGRAHAAAPRGRQRPLRRAAQGPDRRPEVGPGQRQSRAGRGGRVRRPRSPCSRTSTRARRRRPRSPCRRTCWPTSTTPSAPPTPSSA